MRRVIPLISVCLLFAAAAESAFAQQRLFVRTDKDVVELDSRHGSLGTVIRRFPLPAAAQEPALGDVVPFGGGAFLAYANISGVFLLDTRSGAIQHFVLPGFRTLRMVGTDGSARLLVSGLNADFHQVLVVADARSGAVRSIDLGSATSGGPLAYASAANVVFVGRLGPYLDISAFTSVDVLDVGTGTVLKTFDIAPSLSLGLLSNAAGTQLFVNNMFVYDVVSGMQTASVADELPRGVAIVDEVRGRLLALAPHSRRLTAFAMDSLQLLGSVTIPALPVPPNADLHYVLDVNGQSATIFVLQGLVRFPSQNGTDPGGCTESQLVALDVATGGLRKAASTTAALGESACNGKSDLVRITEPGPPPAPRADVAGHQVTLTWRAPFGATHYELEAGSASGLANLATLNVTDTHLTVDGVPSGAYYLRVRAINTIGKSGASQEVQVIVP